MSIFLLEDEFALQEMIKEYLESEGFSVVACGDGERAQELLYEERFDLLLLDVGVPRIDGNPEFRCLAVLVELDSFV